MNSGVLADYFAVGGDHFSSELIGGDHLTGSLVSRNLVPGNSGGRTSLLLEIGFEKALVVASGYETDLLRVGLIGDHEAVLPGQFADFGLGHAAEGEKSAAQLLLR